MMRRRLVPASLLVLAGSAPASLQAATLMGDAADAFDVTVVAEDLSQPTDMAELPDGRVVITERLGGVVVVGTDGATTEAGTITVNPDFGEQGLLGVVADPNFATNNTLYFYASVGSDYPNKHKVYKIPLGTDNTLASSRDTIISMGLRSSLADSPAGFGNHNGGGLFIFENHLYVSVGDSGHNATPPTNRLGTCLNSANGKILRVNLDGSTPDDNPLVDEAMVTGCTTWDGSLGMQAPDERIFSWGFRNPYRFWIDPQTKRMWIGDVGETTREEVSVSSPVDSEAGLAGEHFGWPFREGTTNYSQSWQPENACMGTMPGRECVAPVHDYATTRGGSACVIGGLIPDGCGWEAPWTSRYFFGDNSSGILWTLNVNENRDGIMGGATQIGTSQGVGSFRMGAKGALYLAEVSGGVVSKLTPKGLDPTMCQGSSGGAGGTGGSGASGSGGDTGGTPGTGGSGGSTAGVSPGGNGAGGAANGGGGAATAGSGQQTGGSSTAGTSSSGTGGTTTGAGGTGAPVAGRGGGPAAGGSPGAAGTAGTGGDGEAADDGGCGCRVAGTSGRFGGLLAAASALALFAFRRSRKQRGEKRR